MSAWIASLVLLIGGLAGCVPEIPPPVITTTTSPEVLALQQAREDVAAPVIELAQGTRDIARRMDFIRHEVARGPAMRQALADLEVLAAEVTDQASALEQAVAGMDEELVPTRVAVEALVTLSRAVLAEIAREAAGLQPLMDLDDAMAKVVEGWDDPRSRSEAAEGMSALVTAAEGVRAQAGSLRVHPTACTRPRTNRIRWAALVVQRTEQLRDLALVFDGPGFDQQLQRFERAPYGEDRVAADAESRACWAAHTTLVDVDPTVAEHLAALEEALGG